MSESTPTEQATTRRTKRRYAHELYPHAEEFETRPLAVEVPYLYARTIGMDVSGTGWMDLSGDEIKMAGDRTRIMIEVKRVAVLADALLQGMTGDEAWAWVEERQWDYEGSLVWERAKHYGVPVDQIKPYPCGPEPDHHDHLGEPMPPWGREVIRIASKESECPDCTEDAPTAVPA